MNVIHELDPEKLIQKAGEALNNILRSCEGNPVLLLLSGGSAFQLLPFVDGSHIGSAVMLSVLDERFTGDPEISNFAKLTATPFALEVRSRGAQFFDNRPRRNETPEQCASRWESFLRSWKKQYPTGKIIITQGMGADGHTAGLMPFGEDVQRFEKVFDNLDQWVVGYDAGAKSKYPLRVSTTCSFLRDAVDHSIVFIAGEEKQEAFTRLLSQQGSLAETPIRILREMKTVQVFTDIV